MSKTSILTKITNYILSGGNRTTASNARSLFEDIVNEGYNINDANAGALTGDETLPLVQGVAAKKDTLNNIKTFVSPDLSDYAPLASPAFTGTPTAPTASPSTNNTQLATTAYADSAAAAYAPLTVTGFLCSNYTQRKTIDLSSFTLQELGDLVGTLIEEVGKLNKFPSA